MSIMPLLLKLDYFFARFIEIFAVPATILFFGVAVILTFKSGFAQFRAFPRFWKIITEGFARRKNNKKNGKMETIDSFHALSTAMATTIGMGNIVGPSVAIMAGGPGALFWLVVYIFFASVTKFYEVTFALHTRTKTKDGRVIGGPSQYLKLVSPILAHWYGFVMIFLFAAWSALQSNTLAGVLQEEGISLWITGTLLGLIVLLVLRGGAKRVGFIASKMVPIMFFLYVGFSLFLLFKNVAAVKQAFALIFSSVFSSAAPIGAFLGATVYQAMHMGIYRGIYLSEAGLGTSSIPHAVADTKKPVDQGVLALYSMFSDAIISTLSGLMVLVTGVWTYGKFRNTLIYDAFKMNSPVLGKYVLIITITMFVISTIIGNSFNGTQNFAALTKHRWVEVYKFFMIAAVVLGAFLPAESTWNIMDVMLTLVAVPNVIGILILAFTKPEVTKL